MINFWVIISCNISNGTNFSKEYAAPKFRMEVYPFTKAHGVISHEIIIFILAAAIISNSSDDEFPFYDTCFKLEAEASQDMGTEGKQRSRYQSLVQKGTERNERHVSTPLCHVALYLIQF
jgi:hypothetical protein